MTQLYELVSAVSKWAHFERSFRYTDNEKDAGSAIRWRNEALRICAEYERSGE